MLVHALFSLVVPRHSTVLLCWYTRYFLLLFPAIPQSLCARSRVVFSCCSPPFQSPSPRSRVVFFRCSLPFHSPSMLDRLNALLEPGGVLSISERGVLNGEIPTIKPHPDFRSVLFVVLRRFCQLKYDHTTNSHYLINTFFFKWMGGCTF